jgi:hypothetical protein
MANLYPVAGCRIYIGSPIEIGNVDLIADDFEGETWTEIDGFSTMGAFGDSAAEITTSLINRSRDITQKGTFNAGSMECTFAVMPNDPGQIALIAARSSRANYAFRIVLNDEPAGGGTPGERLFAGLVMSATEQGGEANTIRNLSATIKINTNIVTIPAAGE